MAIKGYEPSTRHAHPLMGKHFNAVYCGEGDIFVGIGVHLNFLITCSLSNSSGIGVYIPEGSTVSANAHVVPLISVQLSYMSEVKDGIINPIRTIVTEDKGYTNSVMMILKAHGVIV